MLNDIVLALCGLVLIVAAMAVLHVSHAAEISVRSASALLIGGAGCYYVGRLFMPHDHAELVDLILPLGAVLWIGQAAWRRRGQPMRRATDWAELDDRSTQS